MDSLPMGSPEGYPHACASGCAPLGAVGPWAVGPGLVSSKTSDTSYSQGRDYAPDLSPDFQGDSGLQASESSPEVVMYRHDGRLRRMRRSVQSAAEIHQRETHAHGQRCKTAMLTLTYGSEVDWEPRQVTSLLKSVRQWLARRGHVCRFVWVLELTQAGRPHYHVLFWLPRGLSLPKPDKQGWWPFGSTRIEWARSAVGYLCKYASKGCEECLLPKGARLSGCGGLSFEGRCLRSWQLCPAWVRELFAVEDRPQRADGGGWLSRLTGAFEPARWRLAGRAADWSWLRFEPVAGVRP